MDTHGTSWDIMGHHGTSWDITGHHGTSWHLSTSWTPPQTCCTPGEKVTIPEGRTKNQPWRLKKWSPINRWLIMVYQNTSTWRAIWDIFGATLSLSIYYIYIYIYICVYIFVYLIFSRCDPRPVARQRSRGKYCTSRRQQDDRPAAIRSFWCVDHQYR